jgi:hypothetical protein
MVAEDNWEEATDKGTKQRTAGWTSVAMFLSLSSSRLDSRGYPVQKVCAM